MNLTLIIPAYKRPASLKRVIAAIKKQTRKPDQFIVVVRDSDLANHEVLNSYPWIQKILVQKPRLTPALNAGLQAATGEIVAFTDDDTEPLPDWLQKIEQHYLNDASIGGVGGRDIIQGSLPQEGVVGKIDCWGRLLGQHHLGMGATQFVQTLKGANMSYRRNLIPQGFLEELRGDQGFNEIYAGAQVLQKKYQILFDPTIQVLHHAEVRAENDRLHPEKYQNTPFNRGYTYGHIQSLAFLLRFSGFHILVGSSAILGILKAMQLCALKKDFRFFYWMILGWWAMGQGIFLGLRHKRKNT